MITIVFFQKIENYKRIIETLHHFHILADKDIKLFSIGLKSYYENKNKSKQALQRAQIMKAFGEKLAHQKQGTSEMIPPSQY